MRKQARRGSLGVCEGLLEALLAEIRVLANALVTCPRCELRALGIEGATYALTKFLRIALNDGLPAPAPLTVIMEIRKRANT